MEYWLPLIFVSLMGLALLLYIILDGYDLGIGILLPLASDEEKDRMIEAIGPFWDANETWIVLGIGILLIAFPSAHGMILTHLYIPVTLMLFGLILRGVAFDFRVKVAAEYKSMWNKLFFVGSLLASMSQGWMLGAYVMGLETSMTSVAFSVAIALSLPAFYVVLGCGWLFIKSEGELYNKAARWARAAILPMGVGLFLISIATPIASSEIAAKWFTLPAAIGLMPIPLMTAVAFFTALWVLSRPQILQAGYGWIVFVCMVLMCLMMALGLAYSIFPDIVIGKMNIWESAASTASLQFALIGTALAVPMILFYTIFIYRIFYGKSQPLSYE
ncbi:MAG: cytochrome d ubiquinol oxidase subunit II [Gammaproteobacteria bacterium]|jgi:cytochrome d ubiquinol oxidase subunit II|nr:cytochrome d ubiquinol oxidase subunit II [Gammaproteobacteria bacterium]